MVGKRCFNYAINTIEPAGPGGTEGPGDASSWNEPAKSHGLFQPAIEFSCHASRPQKTEQREKSDIFSAPSGKTHQSTLIGRGVPDRVLGAARSRAAR